MFEALGRLVVRRRRATLILTGLFLLLAVATLLRGGALTSAVIEGLESTEAQTLADRIIGRNADTTILVIFRSESLDAHSTKFRDAMKESLAPLRGDAGVSSIVTPDDAPSFLSAGMVNAAKHEAIAFVALKGDLREASTSYARLHTKLRSEQLTLIKTGRVAYLRDLGTTLEHDLIHAELLSLPLALLVLLIVFRTAVAAALPVGVGGLAVLGGIAVVIAVSHVTDIADYTINVTSLVGLGVAIDYSLFTVSRYREELSHGLDYEEALVRAVGSAGKVVAFSGLAVATGLAGLFFFRGSYLWALGVGATIVVVLSVVFALTFLPALLAVLGPNIHRGRVPFLEPIASDGIWHATAHWVMKRPVLVLIPTLGLLLFMGAPFLHLQLAAADVRVLPEGVEARDGFDIMARDFPDLAATRMDIAITFPSGSALTKERISALYDLSRRLAKIPGVTKVESLVDRNGVAGDDDEEPSKEDYQDILLHPPELYASLIEEAKKVTVMDNVMLVHAVTPASPESPAARAIVRAIRANRRVGDGTLVVGGQTANDLDSTDFIVSRAPRAVLFVVGVTLLVLFLLLRSVVLPIKAVLMNFVSIAGSFGALVWIYQDGHLWISHARPLEPTLPVLLFCTLFGLSMDYEVLMLSRMKEVFERTGDNEHAVAEGSEKTAGLITSAAAIMVTVFSAFSLAKVVMIQAVGLGMALAVALDATLVRVLLVPASMRLMGRLNWWAPSWARQDASKRPKDPPT